MECHSSGRVSELPWGNDASTAMRQAQEILTIERLCYFRFGGRGYLALIIVSHSLSKYIQWNFLSTLRDKSSKRAAVFTNFTCVVFCSACIFSTGSYFLYSHYIRWQSDALSWCHNPSCLRATLGLVLTGSFFVEWRDNNFFFSILAPIKICVCKLGSHCNWTLNIRCVASARR